MAIQQLRSLTPGCGIEITRCRQFKGNTQDQEVADDVISSEDFETFHEYVCLYMCGLLALVVFEKIEIRHLCNA